MANLSREGLHVRRRLEAVLVFRHLLGCFLQVQGDAVPLPLQCGAEGIAGCLLLSLRRYCHEARHHGEQPHMLHAYPPCPVVVSRARPGRQPLYTTTPRGSANFPGSTVSAVRPADEGVLPTSLQRWWANSSLATAPGRSARWRRKTADE
jgi:hypothetical protein